MQPGTNGPKWPKATGPEPHQDQKTQEPTRTGHKMVIFEPRSSKNSHGYIIIPFSTDWPIEMRHQYIHAAWIMR